MYFVFRRHIHQLPYNYLDLCDLSASFIRFRQLANMPDQRVKSNNAIKGKLNKPGYNYIQQAANSSGKLCYAKMTKTELHSPDHQVNNDTEYNKQLSFYSLIISDFIHVQRTQTTLVQASRISIIITNLKQEPLKKPPKNIKCWSTNSVICFPPYMKDINIHRGVSVCWRSIFACAIFTQSLCHLHQILIGIFVATLMLSCQSSETGGKYH